MRVGQSGEDALHLGDFEGERRRLDIVTVGRDIATVTLVYKVRDRDLVGRQMQTWVRFPEVGWKVIAAHVSTIDKEPTL